MLEVNGWQLFAHPLFLDQIEKLAAAVEKARAKDPRGWRKSANAKLLAAIRQLVFETIPQDPPVPNTARAAHSAIHASTGSGPSLAAGGSGCSFAIAAAPR